MLRHVNHRKKKKPGLILLKKFMCGPYTNVCDHIEVTKLGVM